MRRIGFIAAGALAAGVLATTFAPVAEAVVGAPLTPVSVAGVARRTARRTTVVVASSTPAPAPAPPPATGMVATLPSGCVASGDLFRCGNAYYKPYMQGTTVVYARVS
jgi:hypothetical protein